MDCSIWMLTTFTFDRFVAVCFPLVRIRYCKQSQIYTALTSVTCVSILFNIHVFWTRGVQYCDAGDGIQHIYTSCGYSNDAAERFEYNIKPWLTLSFANIAPFVLILFFNIAIIRAMLKSPSWNIGTTSTYGARNGAVTQHKKTSHSQSTFMCIAVSATFLFCITPAIVLFVGRPLWKKGQGYRAAKAISDQLTNINHAANLFLYCLTGQKFRNQLIAILKCRHTSERGRFGNVVSMKTQSCSNNQGEETPIPIDDKPIKKW